VIVTRPTSPTRESLRCAVVDSAQRDQRIIGVLDYGSSSEGRPDPWSDVDLALFIRDEELDDFTCGWKDRAEQFGRLLLERGRVTVARPLADENLPLPVTEQLEASATIVRVLAMALRANPSLQHRRCG
jgi:hypothetical protein